MSKMTLKTEGDTHVIVTRHFAASPEAVYPAFSSCCMASGRTVPDGWLPAL